ncbi:MAG: SEL1-like repeat protein [Chthoniobacterales bacterium]|nr:SEL1-like repeat protein [Chthoniobacterales bacterium]
MKRAPLLLAILILGFLPARADIVEEWSACEGRVAEFQRKGQAPKDAAGEYCLGLGYATGKIGTRDMARAAKWLGLAAAQNLPAALTALGYHYEKGYGVERDPAKAVALYRRAADQGYADGLLNLGRAYENGVGVPANQTEALKWYGLAAAKGSELAKRALAAAGRNPLATSAGLSSFEEGQRLYLAKDFAGAFRVFLQTAEQGNARAQLQVGSQYEFGEGVAQSYQDAVKWYALAAKQGDSIAQRNLGNMYELGKGVGEDWSQAATWYRRSAGQYDAKGQFALGRMYEFGMGVPQSRGDATAWFHKAASLGNSKAAYFEKHLQGGNFIGFRDENEAAVVLGAGLRFALRNQEPAGRTFRNSNERIAYLVGLRREVDRSEAMTFYSMRKSAYDDCMGHAGEGCVPPGPAPQ